MPSTLFLTLHTAAATNSSPLSREIAEAVLYRFGYAQVLRKRAD